MFSVLVALLNVAGIVLILMSLATLPGLTLRIAGSGAANVLGLSGNAALYLVVAVSAAILSTLGTGHRDLCLPALGVATPLAVAVIHAQVREFERKWLAQRTRSRNAVDGQP